MNMDKKKLYRCHDCGEIKPESDFYKIQEKKKQIFKRRFCNDCKRIRNREAQTRDRLKKYKLGTRQYKKMVREHEGRCAICGKARKLEVDHCHRTGKVRGLLCRSCNQLLGLAKDNGALLESAVQYLAKYFTPY